ncbi:hypothetical protein CFIO01_02827 [Colletotrichum fioriniae PJ7]|uniref:Uncharacterized protein n=1 Tax=Colletotrichum fioriniae PJ7 TaxID=1445577 RepID=A0A010QA06_9PEZI|nr:hypothetical protein CFIO01_02827 [Colletotrichum fioriniae PJ7]
MAEVNPHQSTAEILFKDISERRLPTDPQTLKDFFFDRCITIKGQEKLLSVYALLMEGMEPAIPPAQLQAWAAEGDLELGNHIGTTFSRLKQNKFSAGLVAWFDYNQYIWNLKDVDAELAAHAEEIMGALAGPADDDGYMARIPVFMEGQARLRHKKEALEAKGEYVRTVRGTCFSSVPNVDPNGPPAAGHAIFCPDGFNGVPLSEIARAMQSMPGVFRKKTYIMESKENQTFSSEQQVKPTPSFLQRAMTLTELPQAPQDLRTMQTWFFTRCQTYDQAFNLLRIYQTLLIDLDFTPREIEGCLAQGNLGRNIVMHFENNLGKISEARMRWLMAHVWIFGLEPGAALREDVPVFKFSDEDREYLGQFDAPPEWAGLLTLEIETAMEWELEIARSLARVRAATESKGFLKKWLSGPEEEQQSLTCERRVEPDQWRELYLSWEWRQKIAKMWYRSSRTEWMKR